MKICVYAITKNEEKFVRRWFDSMKEADEIYVLDTGSTDNTVKILKDLGANVTIKEIKPWRFDVARNASLDLVPKDCDICVCTDLDEIFNKGWRKTLEKIWDKDTTKLAYNYNWLIESNVPKVNFYIEKIHKRDNYKWTHPVHEVLTILENKKEIKKTTDEITLNHYPDNTKSRSSYLPLLEMSVKESPNDDRNMHYLGREYMYYGKWNKAIDTLIKHLNMPNATWKDERCASMRFINRCYQNLNRYDEAKMWLEKAIKEAPYLRDPYVEAGLLSYKLNEYDNMVNYLEQALKIKTHTKSYINEIFSWDNTIYDLLAIGYYYQEKYNKSLKMVNIALKTDSKNERLLNNKQIIKQKLKENEQ